MCLRPFESKTENSRRRRVESLHRNRFWEADTGKTRNTFLGGAGTWGGHIASTPIYLNGKEENDAFPAKNIKTNKKSHCDSSERNQKATVTIINSGEFLAEPVMGRKGQLSPISQAWAFVLLLSWAATWCLLSSASAPSRQAVFLMSWYTRQW